MATMPVTQNTEYMYPQAVNQMTDTAANYASGIPGLATQAYQNWYDQPLSTGQTPMQTQAWDTAMSNPSQQWLSPLQQASSMYQQGGTYDPNQLQQFLDPYTNDAANATMAQVNRNLTENILPQVNSTFAGNGQFGSSRNGDFENRAIRDTQTGLAETLAKQNVANYNLANQDYLNWARQQQQSAQGLQGVAGTGSNITQTGLTNQLMAAQAQQQQEQSTLDKNYQDYLTRQQFPLSALQAIGSATSNIGRTENPNVNTPTVQPDAVSRALASLQLLQSGLNSTDIQSLMSSMGLSF